MYQRYPRDVAEMSRSETNHHVYNLFKKKNVSIERLCVLLFSLNCNETTTKTNVRMFVPRVLDLHILHSILNAESVQSRGMASKDFGIGILVHTRFVGREHIVDREDNK